MSESEEPTFYSDSIEPVTRASPNELFLVTIEATPDPDAELYGEVGGAFVNCWINVDDLRTAERRAIEMIQESGWSPQRFDEWSLVTRDDYTEDDQDEELNLQEIFDQAVQEGEVAVFNTWPIDSEDDDEEAEDGDDLDGDEDEAADDESGEEELGDHESGEDGPDASHDSEDHRSNGKL